MRSTFFSMVLSTGLHVVIITLMVSVKGPGKIRHSGPDHQPTLIEIIEPRAPSINSGTMSSTQLIPNETPIPIDGEVSAKKRTLVPPPKPKRLPKTHKAASELDPRSKNGGELRSGLSMRTQSDKSTPTAPSPLKQNGHKGDGPSSAFSNRPQDTPASSWKRSSADTWRTEQNGFRVTIGDDGRVKSIDDKTSIASTVLAPDIVIMRAMGEDPHLAAKLKLVNSTRPMRFKMAALSKMRDKKRALRNIRPQLMTIWQDTSQSIQERKTTLFELWDECIEKDGGLLLRQSIIGFIQSKIPKHSPHAYTPREISKLNTIRTSKMRFEPYVPKAKSVSE